MVGLLDINVLLALFDAVHVHHEIAHGWFDDHSGDGWATCPISENGFLRVVSNPAYGGSPTSLADAIDRLQLFRETEGYTFWTDSVSFCDDLVDTRHVQGHRQLTDVYLLALAVSRGGRLVTLDRSITHRSVRGATRKHLELVAD